MTEALSSIGAVLFVFALLGSLVWLSRRQNLRSRASQSKRIVMEEQARISPQWSVMVIRIDGDIYHIGVSASELRVLYRGAKQ